MPAPNPAFDAFPPGGSIPSPDERQRTPEMSEVRKKADWGDGLQGLETVPDDGSIEVSVNVSATWWRRRVGRGQGWGLKRGVGSGGAGLRGLGLKGGAGLKGGWVQGWGGAQGGGAGLKGGDRLKGGAGLRGWAGPA